MKYKPFSAIWIRLLDTFVLILQTINSSTTVAGGDSTLADFMEASAHTLRLNPAVQTNVRHSHSLSEGSPSSRYGRL